MTAPREDVSTEPDPVVAGRAGGESETGTAPAQWPAGFGVRRYPFWLGRESGTAAWLHVPVSGRVRPACAVICPPIGFELAHSHRSLRRLADVLARAEIPALRFDYFGSGNSAGDAFADELLERWLEQIRELADLGRAISGGDDVALGGLRLGGMLAAHAAERCDARHLVLWAPVVSGRSYVREWEALQRVGAASGEAKGDYLDAGGFVLSLEAAAQLRTLDIGSASPPRRGAVLHLRRDDLRGADRLPDGWPDGAEVESVEAEGFADLMATPQDTVIPHRAVDRIAHWLSERVPSEPAAAIDGDWHDRVSREARTFSAAPAGDTVAETRVVTESFVEIPGSPALFGVHTAPESSPRGTTVVLANAGSVHNIGPHRFYVELSRALALAGFPSVRFDLRNIGESLAEPTPDENHPYPDTAVDDVAAVVRWAADRDGCDRVVVAGLCSGAHASFHAGLDVEGPVLTGAILVNPLTFRWREGMSLAQPTTSQQANDELYYRRRLADPAGWKRLLKLQTDFRGLFRFARGFVGTRVGEWTAELLASAGLRPRSELATNLLRYPRQGRGLAILFSAQDPGRALLLADARAVTKRMTRRGSLRVEIIHGADHTFSARSKREEAVARFTDLVRRAADAG